ncbi:hypothetical protein BN1708_019587, partial [Verticillium longisporum]
ESRSALPSNSRLSRLASTNSFPRISSTFLMSASSSCSLVVSLKLTSTTGRSILTTAATLNRMRLSSSSGRPSAPGTENKSHVCCSLPRVLRESLSTVSRIFRAVMAPDASRLRRREKSTTFPKP